MKTLLTLGTGLLLLTLGTGSWRSAAAAQETTQDPAAQGVEARLATLEAKLVAMEKKNEETRLLAEQTVLWIEKQSKASQSLAGVLDQAQAQGFAAGENWKSRETLLAGWRAQIAAAQEGLPKLPSPPPAPKPAPAKRPARQ